MEIVVTHLTRMRAPYICVAGIDVETNAQIRPIKRQGRLDVNDLLENGGVFAVGEQVDLGQVVDAGSRPEVEDRRFNVATSLDRFSDEDFWDVLERTAAASLEDIFGPDLVPDPPGRTIAPGLGQASLGHLQPGSTPRLYISQNGRIRIILIDDGDEMNLSVTDLRLYHADLQTADQDAVDEVSSAMEKGASVILSVGVGRPYPQESPRHWLQVNNIHLEDDPFWPS